jgi:hypothetical protein
LAPPLLPIARVRSDDVGHWLAGCVLAVVLGGCYSTRTVTAAHLSILRAAEHRADLVVGHDSGVPVRLSPGAQVRFRRLDGTTTGWLPGSRLRVDREMIWVLPADPGARVLAPRAGVDGIRWSALAEMEVNDVDLGKTVLGTTAGGAAIVGAVGVEAVAIGLIACLTGGHLKIDELGFARAVTEVVGSKMFARPQADDSFAAEAPPVDLKAAAERARPLFSPAARRRSVVRVVAGAESGATIAPGGGLLATGGLSAGLRLWSTLELAGGLRLTRLEPGDAGVAADRRWRVSPFVRAGLHLDVDAGRRVAVFAGWELASRQLGLVGGVRWRPGGGPLQIALYPMNPLYLWEKPATSEAPAPPARRSLATMLETTFVF